MAHVGRAPEELRDALDHRPELALGLGDPVAQAMGFVHVRRTADPCQVAVGRIAKRRGAGLMPAVFRIGGTSDAMLDDVLARRGGLRPGLQRCPPVVGVDRIEPPERDAVTGGKTCVDNPLRAGPGPFTGAKASEYKLRQAGGQCTKVLFCCSFEQYLLPAFSSWNEAVSAVH